MLSGLKVIFDTPNTDEIAERPDLFFLPAYPNPERNF